MSSVDVVHTGPLVSTRGHDESEQLAAMRALLLTRLLSYPTPGTGQLIAELAIAAELEAAPIWTGLAQAAGSLREPDQLEAFASEYIDMFDRGKAGASLHETEYGLPLAKGNKLADLAGFYQAFGYAFRGDEGEMLDHVAVELEFYALLLLKTATLRKTGDLEGVEVVLDARRKFFDLHLGSLLAALAEQPGLKDHALFGAVVAAARTLADEEAMALGMAPISVTMRMGEPEEECVACAIGGQLPATNRNSSAESLR